MEVERARQRQFCDGKNDEFVVTFSILFPSSHKICTYNTNSTQFRKYHPGEILKQKLNKPNLYFSIQKSFPSFLLVLSGSDDLLSDCEIVDENEVEEEEEEDGDSQEDDMGENGAKHESDQVTVLLLVTLSHPVGFSLALTLALLDDLPGTSLVPLSTGDVAGAGGLPGTKFTI